MTDFSKNRVLALYKILTKYTDELHQISMQDILVYMEAEGHFCSEDHTYGVFCKYLKHLDVLEEQMKEIDDSLVDVKYQTIRAKAGFYEKLIRVLDMCSMVAAGALTDEEYDKLMEILDEEKVQHYPRHGHASDYFIDRSVLSGE